MTKEEEAYLRKFETRIRQLILKIDELKRENDELYSMIDEKDKDIDKLRADNKLLKEDYANLKLAKMIEISDSELKNAKQRLSKLIREVDKCIALLNL